MNDALFILRILTIFVSAIALGLSVTALYYYVRNRGRVQLRAVPVGDEHIVLLGVCYAGAFVSGIGNVIDSILHDEGFIWYQSPLLLLSLVVGSIGLAKLIVYERASKRRSS